MLDAGGALRCLEAAFASAARELPCTSKVRVGVLHSVTLLWTQCAGTALVKTQQAAIMRCSHGTHVTCRDWRQLYTSASSHMQHVHSAAAHQSAGWLHGAVVTVVLLLIGYAPGRPTNT